MTDVKVLVEGGKASPGAPLGPALGPLGVNVANVVNDINAKTKSFAGIKVPVTVVINKDKTYEIEVGSPPTSQLIAKELGLKKGAKNQKEETVADMTLEQVRKVAEMKQDNMISYDLKKTANEIIGTCVSMGITVTGKDGREVIKDINEGKHDAVFA